MIEGEALDIIIGNKPLTIDKKKKEDDAEEKAEKDAVKKNVMAILKKHYDIEEEDFISAELEIVPAGKARDLGIDRSMILGYGQDDQSMCFYISFLLFWM